MENPFCFIEYLKYIPLKSISIPYKINWITILVSNQIGNCKISTSFFIVSKKSLCSDS